MLKQRVITALVLLCLLIGSLSVAWPWPFAALTLLLVTAAAWEWARLNQTHGVRMLAWVGVVLVACLAAVQAWHIPFFQLVLLVPLEGATLLPHAHHEPHVHAWWHALAGFHVPAWVWWSGLLVWVLMTPLMLAKGLNRWLAWPPSFRLLLGTFWLVLAWLALVELKNLGLNLMLSIMCLVWMADIAAYFGGRQFGQRKLAPSISPGKSWEGAISGAVGTQVLAFAWLWIDQHVAVDSPSLYSQVFNALGPIGLVLGVGFLTAMSVTGDLIESMVKRVAQVKDSSGLLPGHGGVLDRIDALLPVLPVAMALLCLCHGR